MKIDGTVTTGLGKAAYFFYHRIFMLTILRKIVDFVHILEL